ncbi:MAG: hypothetical protein AAGM22_07180 [Acidobacteriota bacterium]
MPLKSGSKPHRPQTSTAVDRRAAQASPGGHDGAPIPVEAVQHRLGDFSASPGRPATAQAASGTPVIQRAKLTPEEEEAGAKIAAAWKRRKARRAAAAARTETTTATTAPPATTTTATTAPAEPAPSAGTASSSADDSSADGAPGLDQLGGLSINQAVASLGDRLPSGQGSFKQVFRFDPPHDGHDEAPPPVALARLIHENPKGREQLREELGRLETLRGQGVPVPEVYGHNLPAEGDDVPQGHRTGVAMQYIDGATFDLKESHGIVHVNNLGKALQGQSTNTTEAGRAMFGQIAVGKGPSAPADPAPTAEQVQARAAQAAADLGRIRDHLNAGNVISDLQAMVDKHTGRAYVIDPLAVGRREDFTFSTEESAQVSGNEAKLRSLHEKALELSGQGSSAPAPASAARALMARRGLGRRTGSPPLGDQGADGIRPPRRGPHPLSSASAMSASADESSKEDAETGPPPPVSGPALARQILNRGAGRPSRMPRNGLFAEQAFDEPAPGPGPAFEADDGDPDDDAPSPGLLAQRLHRMRQPRSTGPASRRLGGVVTSVPFGAPSATSTTTTTTTTTTTARQQLRSGTSGLRMVSDVGDASPAPQQPHDGDHSDGGGEESD